MHLRRWGRLEAKKVGEGDCPCQYLQGVQKRLTAVEQTVLLLVSVPPLYGMVPHTVHWPSVTPVAIIIARVSPLHSMRIKQIFPVSNLSDLLLTVLVFLVVVRSARIVNVIPVLLHMLRFFVLFALLSSSTLSLLAVKVTDVIIIYSPVCNGRLDRSWTRCCGRWIRGTCRAVFGRWGRCLGVCFSRRLCEFACYCFRFRLLGCELRPFGRLKM